MIGARIFLPVALLLSCLATAAFSCVPPDCDRPDFGTCVNACCKLEYSFSGLETSAKDLVTKIASAIAHGGPDGRYYPVEKNAVQPWSSAADFVVQSTHETVKRTYNDTLHLAVTPGSKAGGHDAVKLHAFSHSQDFISGNFAYGDHGQNYKNIVTLVKALAAQHNLQYTELTLFGCPVNKSTAVR